MFSNYFVKLLFLILIVFSYPLSQLLKFSFVLSLVILFLLLVYVWLKRQLKKDIQHYFAERLGIKVLLPWIELFSIFLLIYMFLGALNNFEVHYSKWVIIAFCWALPLVGLYVVIRNIVTIISEAKRFSGSDSLLNKIKFMSILFGAMILTLVGPSMAFGFGYDFFFKNILDVEIGSKFESFYLILMLTNTLPVSDVKYSELISLVNKNTTLSYFHTFQLFFIKLVDGILLVAIFNLLSGVLKITRV